jgi:hypothetical protein
MASISVDVELHQLPDREIAYYVAENDDLWAKCLRAREESLRRRGARLDEEAVRRAIADGLITEAAGAR